MSLSLMAWLGDRQSDDTLGTNGMSYRNSRGFRKHVGVILGGSLMNLTLAGCFPLQPLEGTPAPATDVRVHLTPPAAARISGQTVLPVSSVAGRVVDADGDSLVLLVRWGSLGTTAQGRTGEEVVHLGRSEIERIESPRFSLSRTVLFAAGGALLIVGLLSIAPGIIDPSDDDDPPPPQPR